MNKVLCLNVAVPNNCILKILIIEYCRIKNAVIFMQVKSIFTSKRVAIIITVLYVLLLLSAAPVYFVNKLGMVFFPNKNKSILALVGTHDRKPVEKASFAFNNVTIPLAAFVVITFCTIILVLKLRNQAKWRQSSTTSAQIQTVSNRDKKVVKMVVVISTLFIVCFIPVCIIFIPMSAIPEFAVDGKYKNENTVFVGVGLIMESANSAGNIFIYYFMSSKYKQIFQEIFRLRSQIK